MTEEITKPSERGKRGFSAMDPEKHREIASKGGKAVHAQGKAHEFTSEEAREAGRKGAAARMAARGTGGTEIHPSVKVPQETLVGKCQRQGEAEAHALGAAPEPPAVPGRPGTRTLAGAPGLRPRQGGEP